MFSGTYGPSRRPSSCTARATMSLPVPDSPWSRIGTRDFAWRRMSRAMRSIGAEVPITPGNGSLGLSSSSRSIVRTHTAERPTTKAAPDSVSSAEGTRAPPTYSPFLDDRSSTKMPEHCTCSRQCRLLTAGSSKRSLAARPLPTVNSSPAWSVMLRGSCSVPRSTRHGPRTGARGHSTVRELGSGVSGSEGIGVPSAALPAGCAKAVSCAVSRC